MITVQNIQEAYESDDDDVIVLGMMPANETLPKHFQKRKMTIEVCSIYIAQLKRKYGDPPTGASFFILATQLGNIYEHEACIKFRRDSEKCLQYAMLVEFGDLTWDNEAQKVINTFLPPLSPVN